MGIKRRENLYRGESRGVEKTSLSNWPPILFKQAISRWRRENPPKPYVRITAPSWREDPEREARRKLLSRIRTAFSTPHVRCRTPAWLTEADFHRMILIYVQAADAEELFGEPCQVDHVVPLQGEVVSGLHVPWNLRVMLRSENAKKHNEWQGWRSTRKPDFR